MLHQIGVGALGPVFRAYEPERDRLVAVKAFRLDITPEQARAIADELDRVCDRGLFHPSIVELVAAGVEGTLAYAAEEYVAAESLDVALRQQTPASIDTVLLIVTQLAGAIDFARAAGVGHGALHPRDIFVTPEEEARATGFGVVEALERIGIRAPVRRPYSPPERIAGEPWSTPADVFSLAAIAYELLTGRRPAGLGPQVGALTAGTPNRWMDALHGVLARAMDESPSRRHPTALAFASDFKAAAQGHRGAVAYAAGAAGAVPVADDREGPEKTKPDVPTAPAAELPASPAHAQAAADSAASAARAESDGAGPGDEQAADLPEHAYLAGPAEEVLQERENDEAQHQLTLRELNEPTRSARPPSLPAEKPDTSIGDLALTGAGGAAGPKAGDRFLELEPEIKVEPAILERAPVPAVEPVPGREPRERSQAVPARGERLREWDDVSRDRLLVASEPERSRSAGIWPVAVLLLAGLLAGFLGGYALWGRGALPAPAVAPASSPGAASSGVADGGEPGEDPGDPPDVPAEPAVTLAPDSTADTDAPVAPAPAAAAPPSEPAPARPASGRLVVRSTPSGAGVTVNGTWRGRTPLTLEDLPLGTYLVRLVQPGFTPSSHSVALSAGNTNRTVSVRLQRQPAAARTAPAPSRPAAPAASPSAGFTGSIYVDSRPRGARVSINGKPYGVTPLRVPEMRIGTHVVRMELPDHRIWSSTARVTAGQEVRVTGSLEPIQ